MISSTLIPDSGDIVWFNLDPRTGHEQSCRRPCLVLSYRSFTERTGLAVICPITSKAKGLPFEIVLSQTKTKGVVLPIHVRSIDVAARRPKFIEKAPRSLLKNTRQYIGLIVSVV